MLVVEGSSREGRQMTMVAVQRDGRELWRDELPGFVVRIHGDVVAISDQTGGTGSFLGNGQTMVSAYELLTGELRWQVPLPDYPQMTAGVGSLIVVPVGTSLYALSAESGEIVWESDPGSPGRGGRYTVPGSFTFLESTDTEDTVLVGVIVAEEPYRD